MWAQVLSEGTLEYLLGSAFKSLRLMLSYIPPLNLDKKKKKRKQKRKVAPNEMLITKDQFQLKKNTFLSTLGNRVGRRKILKFNDETQFLKSETETVNLNAKSWDLNPNEATLILTISLKVNKETKINRYECFGWYLLVTKSSLVNCGIGSGCMPSHVVSMGIRLCEAFVDTHLLRWCIKVKPNLCQRVSYQWKRKETVATDY